MEVERNIRIIRFITGHCTSAEHLRKRKKRILKMLSQQKPLLMFRNYKRHWERSLDINLEQLSHMETVVIFINKSPDIHINVKVGFEERGEVLLDVSVK